MRTAPKRRARLQTFGHQRKRGLAAILAMACETLDARHHRLDRRQIDFVVPAR
jgi:hypothetical protein